MAVRGLLFDKDGTLLDFQASWTPIIRQAAASAAGHDLDLARLLMIMGGFDPETEECKSGSVLAAGNTRDLAELWAPHVADAEVDPLTETLERIFQEGAMLSATPVMPLEELFQGFSAEGYSIGCATNDSEAGAEATLKKFGIYHHFHFVCGYDSGHGPKPEPGMIEAFCRAIGHAPDEVMMVGDNTHDLEMARAAGAISIGVLTGNGSEADLGPLSDHLLSSIADLPALLRSETQKGPGDPPRPSA